MACILLCSSAVRVHDSQAYRKVDVTRERISRILELRETLLSFQTGSNLVNEPQRGAVDAEIKVPSGENTALKRSSFKLKPRVDQYIDIRATLTAWDFFLDSFRSIHPHFFPKPLPTFPLRGLWLLRIPV